MDLNDLFKGNDSFLIRANSLVATLTRKISEAKKINPSFVPVLMEKRNATVKCINEYTSNMFLEDHVEDIEAFILDLIISIKERGVDKMPLSLLQKELVKNGLEVNTEFLVDYLSNIDGVQEVNPGKDSIVFNTSVDRGVSDDEAAKEKEKIHKTAVKTAQDNLKNNEEFNLEK